MTVLSPKELITLDLNGDDQIYLEIYDSKLKCQGCEKLGSYYTDGSQFTDSGKIGVCFDCLDNDKSEMEILE